MSDDPAAAVWREAYPDLIAMLTGILRDPDQARDVAQEAGLRMAAFKGELRDARGFLFHVAANLARDLLRRHKVRLEHAQAVAAEPAPVAGSAEQALHDADGLRRIGQAMEALPPRARAVMWHSRVMGRSNAEVAAALSMSVKTVEKHLSLGLARLAMLLRQREHGGKS